MIALRALWVALRHDLRAIRHLFRQPDFRDWED